MQALRRFRVHAVALALGMALGACAGPNLLTDLSSVSTGRSNRGRIRNPAKLPLRGLGFRVSERWKERGFQYGVDELVAAVQRAGARVHAKDRRAVLGVADFSRNRGGSSKWHNSHHSGRDVDLLFYTTDGKGKPLPAPDEMITFDEHGKPYAGPRNADGYKDPAWAERRFDVRRNWELMEALLTDASIRVQWVFVSEGLEALMLGWARRHGRPKAVIAHAAVVMNTPKDAPPHDNHFHVRIYCSRADRFHGCDERGPVWQHEKKTFKYGGPERYDPVTWRRRVGTPNSAWR